MRRVQFHQGRLLNVVQQHQHLQQQQQQQQPQQQQQQHRPSPMDDIITSPSHRLKILEEQLTKLQCQHNDLLENLERINRSSDIIIDGIPTKVGENIKNLFTNICTVINHSLSPYAIAFRLKINSRQAQGNQQQQQNSSIIIGKFSCLAERKSFFSSLRDHKGIKLNELEGFTEDRRITFRESISTAMVALLRKCKQLKFSKMIFTTFPRDGYIYVKLRDGDRALRVTNYEQLIAMCSSTNARIVPNPNGNNKQKE